MGDFGSTRKAEQRAKDIIRCRWTVAICSWLAKNPTRNAKGDITMGAPGSPDASVDRTFNWLNDNLPKKRLSLALAEQAAAEAVERATTAGDKARELKKLNEIKAEAMR